MSPQKGTFPPIKRDLYSARGIGLLPQMIPKHSGAGAPIPEKHSDKSRHYKSQICRNGAERGSGVCVKTVLTPNIQPEEVEAQMLGHPPHTCELVQGHDPPQGPWVLAPCSTAAVCGEQWRLKGASRCTSAGFCKAYIMCAHFLCACAGGGGCMKQRGGGSHLLLWCAISM